LIACGVLWPLAGHATNDVSVSYRDAKELFAFGDQHYCMDGPYHAKPGDPWLALAQTAKAWVLEDAFVSPEGEIKARDGEPAWFFKNQRLPFGPGPVVVAALEPATTVNRTITATTFDFGGKHWRWVESGADMFYLSDGARRWTTSASQRNGELWIEPAEVELPEAYRRAPLNDQAGVRDEYEDGVFQLRWAGDLNNDGILDFIVYSMEKEAWGDALWMGERTQSGNLRFKQVLASHDGCD